jgi:hypothetical protein
MDKNILFYQNEAVKIEMGDLLKDHTIKYYDAIGIDKLERGAFLFQYEYKTLLSYEDYETLLSMHNYTSVTINLYRTISLIYNSTYAECIKWYYQKSRIKDVFDINKEIDDIKNLKINKLACPIIGNVTHNNLEDVDVFNWIKATINKSYLNKISNVEDILYKKEKVKNKFNRNYNDNGKDVINKINNIVYKRFLIFLEKQNKLIKSAKAPISYFTLLDQISTKECYKILIEEGFIHKNTKQKEFDDIFNKSAKRIDWIGTKQELARFIYYLFNNSVKENSKAVCKKIKDKFEVASKIFYIDNIQVTATALKDGNRNITNLKRRNDLLSAVKTLRNNRKK